jgi:hypothetical protein
MANEEVVVVVVVGVLPPNRLRTFHLLWAFGEGGGLATTPPSCLHSLDRREKTTPLPPNREVVVRPQPTSLTRGFCTVYFFFFFLFYLAIPCACNLTCLSPSPPPRGHHFGGVTFTCHRRDAADTADA